MDHPFLDVYHRLPAPMRSAVATLRGYYLRFWRYGPRSDELTQAALARDSWSADRWRSWREEHLARLLDRAATRVPFYRAIWTERRRHGDQRSWEVLDNWPVVEKEDVRANPRAFVADDCDLRRMLHEQTSGTTGKPVEIWRTRPTVESLYALANARTRDWFGIPDRIRWARLGGQLVTPVRQRRPPFWVWNAAMRQLYMSSYHLASDLLPYYLDALARYRIEYMAGYTSSLVALARAILRSGRRDLRMRAAITNAEPLDAEQRDVIGEAFQCPVIETYGMVETVAAASECPHGSLHQWPEVGHIEVWRDGVPAEAGETGELICTGLLNRDMPLVRYRVGDSGGLPRNPAPCACGRTLPLIAGIEGRTSDVLVTPDGRTIHRLTPVFYGLPVRESQVVQETLSRLTVLVAPAPEYTSETGHTITRRMRERIGEGIQVDLAHVAEVPRTENGKVRLIVSKLSAEERDAVLNNSRQHHLTGPAQ